MNYYQVCAGIYADSKGYAISFVGTDRELKEYFLVEQIKSDIPSIADITKHLEDFITKNNQQCVSLIISNQPTVCNIGKIINRKSLKVDEEYNNLQFELICKINDGKLVIKSELAEQVKGDIDKFNPEFPNHTVMSLFIAVANIPKPVNAHPATGSVSYSWVGFY